MDEDNLNIEIRKFLKKVGITSQREIENYIRKKFAEGNRNKYNLALFLIYYPLLINQVIIDAILLNK